MSRRLPISHPVAFFKVSGAGNDFIVVLVPPGGEPAEETIRTWCRRGVSLGADGLITLERTDRGGRIVHRNPDGGRSELCLNGSRCAAQLVFHLGWQTSTLLLQTDSGTLDARHVDELGVSLELPPIVTWPERRVLEVDGEPHDGCYVVAGVPHFVLPWTTPEGKPASLGGVPIARLGPQLRSHADLYPQGANVDFVRYTDRHRFELRTFERGVEAETLACGTGVVASAVAGVVSGELELPAVALTAGGFELTVDGEIEDGEVRRLELGGDARVVAKGDILPGAAVVPSRPRWSG